MTTENLYVIAVKDKKYNETDNVLVSDKVYDKKTAESLVKENQIVLTLKEWASENYDAGYLDAYG